MIGQDRLFGNFFDDIKIINSRLYNYSLDSLNRLTAANGGGDYQTLIDLITPLISAFGTEIGDVDVALSIQKGKTLTANQVMFSFGQTMKEKEGVIANAVGGFGSTGYLEFYPNGFGEYTGAAVTAMPMLTSRVKTAATAHAVALGPVLTAQLSAFQQQWIDARDAQEQQFGVVDDNRTERTETRVALELGNLTVVHTIAAKFPGDVDACDNFFDFNLLFTHTMHRIKTLAGTPAPGQIVVILNHSLTDNNTIQAQNPDENADYQLYLDHTGTGEPNGRGITLKASGSGKRPKPSDLGDLNDTFLCIKNLSDVNEGTYIVKVGGLEE
ncbi:MAG TPA: hypothetical protein VI757_02750 [Bacteroidia bacterium]|nr:hypothetical protein [Bacteroidia bacterium]